METYKNNLSEQEIKTRLCECASSLNSKLQDRMIVHVGGIRIEFQLRILPPQIQEPVARIIEE